MKKKEENPKPRPTPAHPEVVVGQTLAAFGQGAVQTPLSDDAVRYLRQRYLKKAAKFAKVWSEHRGRQVLIAREAGRLASFYAAQAGRAEITGADVQTAMASMDASVSGICSWS